MSENNKVTVPKIDFDQWIWKLESLRDGLSRGINVAISADNAEWVNKALEDSRRLEEFFATIKEEETTLLNKKVVFLEDL